MSWHALDQGAPDIATVGSERFARDQVALLGTLRRDGRPRISPIAPYIARGELLLGAMRRSAKARDLVRDPRCVVHSAVSDPHGADGELKLSGRAVEVADPHLRDAPAQAWWVGRSEHDALVVAIQIDEAALLSWDTAQESMTVRRWSPDLGYREDTRAYP